MESELNVLFVSGQEHLPMDPESCLGMKKLRKIQKNGPDDFIERKSQA